MTEQLYYHFLPLDGKTRYRTEQAIVGKTLSFAGTPIVGKVGYHASKRIVDALVFAPIEPNIRLEGVYLRGDVEHNDNQSAAASRHTLWMMTSYETTRLLLVIALVTAKLAIKSEADAGRTPASAVLIGVTTLQHYVQNEQVDYLDVCCEVRAVSARANGERHRIRYNTLDGLGDTTTEAYQIADRIWEVADCVGDTLSILRYGPTSALVFLDAAIANLVSARFCLNEARYPDLLAELERQAVNLVIATLAQRTNVEILLHALT